jgi:hypothetical protein
MKELEEEILSLQTEKEELSLALKSGNGGQASNK